LQFLLKYDIIKREFDWGEYYEKIDQNVFAVVGVPLFAAADRL
jgi:hypothetical protein